MFTTLFAHCSRFFWYLQHFMHIASDSFGIYNTFCTMLQISLVFTTLSASSPELWIASPRLFQNPDSLCVYNTFCTLLQILLVFPTLYAHCSRFSWYLQHFLHIFVYTAFFVVHNELAVQNSLPKSNPELWIASPRLFQNPDSLSIYNTFCTL